MRTINKYIRNRAYRSKHWHRIRSEEHPFKTYMPFWIRHKIDPISIAEEQIIENFKSIERKSRAIENGSHRNYFNAPKHFRKLLWKTRKAQERNALNKIRNGNYDGEIPIFKKDANWLWF